jgi:hypothetical protein
MSRELLAFLLSELQIVRMVCQGKRNNGPCGHVIELPLEQLGTFFNQVSGCPFCKTPFGVFSGGPSTMEDPFGPLAKAIADLRSIGGRIQLEFVLSKKE